MALQPIDGSVRVWAGEIPARSLSRSSCADHGLRALGRQGRDHALNGPCSLRDIGVALRCLHGDTALGPGTSQLPPVLRHPPLLGVVEHLSGSYGKLEDEASFGVVGGVAGELGDPFEPVDDGAGAEVEAACGR